MTANELVGDAAPPVVGYWHLWRDADGVSHQTRCALRDFEQTCIGQASAQWNDERPRGEATVVFTVLPADWVGEWHENPAPQWIVPLSGGWWVESMDGTRVQMRAGELSLGEDQGCVADAQARRGHRSGTLDGMPTVLLVVQRHVPAITRSCHIG